MWYFKINKKIEQSSKDKKKSKTDKVKNIKKFHKEEIKFIEVDFVCF